MRKTALVLLLLAVVLQASARHHKHSKKCEKNPAIKSVAIVHNGCYGRCPVYTITVAANGITTYAPERFTADSGTFTKQTGAEKTQEILSQVINSRLDTCRDTYIPPNPDISGVFLKIAYADSTKTIYNANYGPMHLQQMVRSIDALVAGKVDDSWTKQPSKPKK